MPRARPVNPAAAAAEAAIRSTRGSARLAPPKDIKPVQPAAPTPSSVAAAAAAAILSTRGAAKLAAPKEVKKVVAPAKKTTPKKTKKAAAPKRPAKKEKKEEVVVSKTTATKKEVKKEVKKAEVKKEENSSFPFGKIAASGHTDAFDKKEAPEWATTQGGLNWIPVYAPHHTIFDDEPIEGKRPRKAVDYSK